MKQADIDLAALLVAGQPIETAQFTVDVLCPVPNDGREGERELCKAMIEAAVGDLTASAKGRRRHSEQARLWITGEGAWSRSWLTFCWCCEALNLDPGRMREAILRMAPRPGRARKMSHGIAGGRTPRDKPKIYVRQRTDS